MEYRLRASRKQFLLMLDYMERNGDLSKPQPGLQGRLKVDNHWKELVRHLNSVGDNGIRKPMEKWKRVWSDWKTKTKKKALHFKKMKQGAFCGRIRVRSLNPLENRILKLIGLDYLRGLEGEQKQYTIQCENEQEEDGSEAQTSPEPDVQTDRSPLPQPAEEVLLTSSDHQQHLEENFSYSNVQALVKLEVTHDASALSPDAAGRNLNEEEETDNREPTRSPSACASNPRRRRFMRQRRQHHPTPLEQLTSEFVRIEEGRLRLEELRIQTQHQREMEQLRVESQRLTMEQSRNDILQQIADTVQLILQVRQVIN